MTTRGIEETVKHCYSTWSKDYYHDYYSSAAAYPPVHRDLIRSLLSSDEYNCILDAGCGPASMLRDLTQTCPALYGFDLTPEMVSEAKVIMQDAGTPADHIWEGSVLERSSFTPPDLSPTPEFDASICVGVLPHIPAECDSVVMENLVESVRPGGLVIAEARNELFSLFTLNRYSNDLFNKSLIRTEQLREDFPHDSAAIDQAEALLQDQFRMDLPPIRTGKQDEPGYDEVLSRTHNPFEITEVAKAAGLEDVQLKFYHFHAMPPMFESLMPDTFRQASLAQENPDDWRGHFLASAFLVCGKRAK